MWGWINRPVAPTDDEVVEEIPWPEYMVLDFPDGTVRRCRTSICPTWGYPTTPGFNSPEWEIVDPDTLLPVNEEES